MQSDISGPVHVRPGSFLLLLNLEGHVRGLSFERTRYLATKYSQLLTHMSGQASKWEG